MDFTYFLAAIAASLVGFFASCVYVLRGRGSRRRLIVVTSTAALALNLAGLINWEHIGDLSPGLILFDFALIAAYSFIGSSIGASLALILSALWKRFRRRRATEQ